MKIKTSILLNLMLVKFLSCLTVFGVFPMLPGVYMVKFDMLNPNLTSKITKNLKKSQKHRKDILSTKSKKLKTSNKLVNKHDF